MQNREPTIGDVYDAVTALADDVRATGRTLSPALFIDYASLGGILRKANDGGDGYRGDIRPDFNRLRNWSAEVFGTTENQFFAVLENRGIDPATGKPFANPFVRTIDWLNGNGFVVNCTNYTPERERSSDDAPQEVARFFMYQNMTMALTMYAAMGGRHIVVLTTNPDMANVLSTLKQRFKDLKVTLIASNLNEDDLDKRLDRNEPIVPEMATFTNTKLMKTANTFVEMFDQPIFQVITK